MSSNFISTKTMKVIVIFLAAMINQACANPNNAQQEFIAESVLNTSFVAVVSHKKLTKLSSNKNDGDEYELSAEIISIISGRKQKVINYRMFVEPGEEVVLNQDPVILFLCESEEGYYWPGVGAEFPATASSIKAASKAAKLKSSKSPSELDQHCHN